jgi:hypothetical protein
MVFHLLSFMVDITHSILFWVYLNNYCTTWMCYICPGPVFLCEFSCDVNLGFGPTCFGNFEYVYTFCAILPCKFNYNVCLVIKITGFGNFQNQCIVICILIQL